MSLQSNFNIVFSLYRKTQSNAFPPVVTWKPVKYSGIGGYASNATKRRLLDNGDMVTYELIRLRMLPMDCLPGDRVYFNSKLYQVDTYEDFDGLGKEAVAEITPLNDSYISEIT